MKFVTFCSMVYYETGIGFGKMIQLAKYILHIKKKRNKN